MLLFPSLSISVFHIIWRVESIYQFLCVAPIQWMMCEEQMGLVWEAGIDLYDVGGCRIICRKFD